MSKIRVSKKIYDALEQGIEVYGKEKLLRLHSSPEKWSLDIYLPLNDLNSLQLAEILIKDYQKEETPEEKILSIHGKSEKIKNEALKLDGKYYYHKGITHGIEMILDIKGEIIKGIND